MLSEIFARRAARAQQAPSRVAWKRRAATPADRRLSKAFLTRFFVPPSKSRTEIATISSTVCGPGYRWSIAHDARNRQSRFRQIDLLFIENWAAALPDLAHEDLHWRFHFLVGAMIYTMSDSGSLKDCPAENVLRAKTDFALASMVATFSALFRRPQWFAPRNQRVTSKTLDEERLAG